MAATGAAPDQVAGAQVGLSQLSSVVSHAWRAAPFLIGATVAGAGAVAVEVADDDVSFEEAKELVDEAVGPPGTAIDGDDDQPDGDPGPEGSTDLTIDDIRAVLVQELDRDLVSDDDIDRIAERVAEVIGDGERLRAIIREEVPGAELDGVTSSALGQVTRDSPTRPLGRGETLWSVALEVRDDPATLGCDGGPHQESVAVYVRRIWAANAGILGGDPDRIDPAAEIRVPCPE